MVHAKAAARHGAQWKMRKPWRPFPRIPPQNLPVAPDGSNRQRYHFVELCLYVKSNFNCTIRQTGNASFRRALFYRGGECAAQFSIGGRMRRAISIRAANAKRNLCMGGKCEAPFLFRAGRRLAAKQKGEGRCALPPSPGGGPPRGSAGRFFIPPTPASAHITPYPWWPRPREA